MPKTNFRKKKGARITRKVKGGKVKTKKLVIFENKIKKGGFPDTYFTPLEYDNAAFGMGNNTTPCHLFSFSATEPTKANTIAPQGWTSLKGIYDLFIVHYINIKLTFYNKQAVPCKVFCGMIDQDSSAFPTPGAITQAQGNTLSQQAYTKIGHMSCLGGGKDVCSINFKMKIAKFQGKPKITLADERNVGNTGSGVSSVAFTAPVYLPKFYYGVINVDGSNISTNGVYCEEKDAWLVQFCERLQYT